MANTLHEKLNVTNMALDCPNKALIRTFYSRPTSKTILINDGSTYPVSSEAILRLLFVSLDSLCHNDSIQA